MTAVGSAVGARCHAARREANPIARPAAPWRKKTGSGSVCSPSRMFLSRALAPVLGPVRRSAAGLGGGAGTSNFEH